MDPQKRQSTKSLRKDSAGKDPSSRFIAGGAADEGGHFHTFGELTIGCKLLDFEQFLEAYDHPFLLQISLSGSRMGLGGYFTSEKSGPKLGKESDLLLRPVFPVRQKSGPALAISIKVGRVEINDIYLPNEFISKFHATFFCAGSDWFVTDQESRNGTALNGRVITPLDPTKIVSGQEVTFSRQLSVFFLSPLAMFNCVRDCSSLT